MRTNLQEIRQVREEADCLVDADTVSAALQRLAAEIGTRLSECDPQIFVVMNGGLVFAGRLLPMLDFPLEVGYLHATRYGHALSGRQIDWRVYPTLDPRGRTVLVVDDILDEGHTLLAIVEALKAQGAREVLTAVLVDKRHDRKAVPGMRADFTGLEVADRFLFGCGMDYKGYWRNAPGIYALKGQ